jgi:hypothetical protein
MYNQDIVYHTTACQLCESPFAPGDIASMEQLVELTMMCVVPCAFEVPLNPQNDR